MNMITPKLAKQLEKCNHEYRLLALAKRGYMEGSHRIAEFYCTKCLEVVSKTV